MKHLVAQRGEALTTILVVVGLLAATQLVPNWRPQNWGIFQKAPATQQLTTAQAELDKAKAEAAKAEAALKAYQDADARRKDSQLRYGQQMAAGAAESLSLVPSASRGPEINLASSLLLRANTGLAAAIGDLTAEKQAEIHAIVAGSLSKVQAELDAARTALAVKDNELAVSIVERRKLEAEIPALQATVAAKEKELEKHVAVVAEKTKQVVSFAARAEEKDREAGSFKTQLEKLLCVTLWIAGVYAFLAFVLPGLIKHLDSGRLKDSLRGVAGYLTSPLLYMDAKKKISDLKTPPK